MCVCLEISLFGKLHCWNSYTTTTEHVSSLSIIHMTICPGLNSLNKQFIFKCFGCQTGDVL